MIAKRFVLTTGMVVLAAALAGCGSGGSGGGMLFSASPSTATVTGVAIKGPMAGAGMAFYGITSSGGRGSLIARATADENGRFSTSLAMGAAGPVWVEATVTRHRDEATQQMMSTTSTRIVTFCIPEVTPGQSVTAPLTPFNHMAFRMAMAAGGVSSARMRAGLQALSSAVGTNLEYQMPADLSTRDGMRMAFAGTAGAPVDGSTLEGMYLAGMSERARELGMDGIDYMLAMGRDFEDGRLDGVAPGQRVIAGFSTREMDAVRTAAGMFRQERSADVDFAGAARMVDAVDRMRSGGEPAMDMSQMPALVGRTVMSAPGTGGGMMNN